MHDYEPDRPIWIQVVEILESRIHSGEYQPRHLVPSEAQMVQEFGIARTTARKVVAYLRDQGLVYTVPQIGTFVSYPGRKSD
ncbi:winged helix-turn-helix domain-containing protein [Streptosporangium sp. NPDC000239]|uniref:winged helix-turn-helix domain-containing protein n=1 Tax=unclassified Streptosporangium TaxID=2632669 RepID=UPI0033292ECD